MRALAMAASLVAEVVAAARKARCQHRMIPMTDGPVCGSCGRAWTWS